MTTYKCRACCESPRGTYYYDNRFCRRCSAIARHILFKQWKRGVLSLELVFAVMERALIVRHRIRLGCFAKIRGKDEEELEQDMTDASLFDDAGPSDVMFLKQEEYFSSGREAKEVAEERFVAELARLVKKERERLSSGGRRRTNLTFTPFKKRKVCTSPSTPRSGMVPGAPVNGNRRRPTAGEEPMKATLQTCDVCTFIQFTPQHRGDTTCAFCTIVRKYTPVSEVGATTRALHKLLCLFETNPEASENEVTRICKESQRVHRTVAEIIAGRIDALPHCVCCKEPMSRRTDVPACKQHEPWRRECIRRIEREHFPDDVNSQALVPTAWESWTEIAEGNGDIKDETAWKLVMDDLVRREWDRVALPGEGAEPISPPLVVEVPVIETVQPPSPSQPEPEPTPEPILEPVQVPEHVPVPLPSPIPDPIPTSPPTPQPEPVVTRIRTGLGKPDDGNPLPPAPLRIEQPESVWLSNTVSHRYKTLSREQRYQLVAIRRIRVVEIATTGTKLRAQEIGAIFNQELPAWVVRIMRGEEHPALTVSRDVINTRFDTLIQMIEKNASKEELIAATNQLREQMLSLTTSE